MFEPGFLTSAAPGAPSLVVRVRGGTVKVEEGALPEQAHFLGSLDGLPCVAVEEPDDAGTVGLCRVAPPVGPGRRAGLGHRRPSRTDRGLGRGPPVLRPVRYADTSRWPTSAPGIAPGAAWTPTLGSLRR